MNDDSPVLPQHYQLLCGMALGLVFLVQLRQGQPLFGLATFLIGTLAVVLRVRLSPILVLMAVVGGQVYAEYVVPTWRPEAALQVEEVLLSAAMLAYVAGHYRLLALWSRILPPDPRQRYAVNRGTVVPLSRVGQVVAHHRPAVLLTQAEIAWFVVQTPLFALLAQAVWVVVGAPRAALGLPARWMQFLQLAWGLALGLFVAVQLFRYLRLLRMDRMTARMLLQDVLWQETRGDQRRIARWRAWARLRAKGET